MRALRALMADVRLYADDGPWYAQAGFWATATYRLGSLAYEVESRPLRLGLLGVHRALSAPWRVIKGVHIPARAQIGPGFRLPHPQNIMIPAEAVIGRECSIYQDVTLGRNQGSGHPSLGDQVMVYPGARILGQVHLGDRVHVGANAVVTRDVPAGATVTAPAARVIPRQTAELLRPGSDRATQRSSDPRT